MQLRDDKTLKPLIDYVQSNKSKHRGIMRTASKKIGIHANHATKVGKGTAPYSPENVRVLRSIANIILKEQEKTISLVSQTVDSLPAA